MEDVSAKDLYNAIKKFPDYFPKNCPPTDAVENEIQAYRICKSNPVAHSDFLSYYELGKPIKSTDKFYGASLFTDANEAKAIAKMPNHKNEFIAVGITKAECGVVKHTPPYSNPVSSHITWWLYEGAKPENYFTIMEENDGK